MNSFRVEPTAIRGLAGRFGQLVTDFESLGVAGLEFGNTGDANLTQSIEHFVECSRHALGELTNQFGQLQTVLIATANGYENVDARVASEVDNNLLEANGPVGGASKGP